jgi:flagellar protein FliS
VGAASRHLQQRNIRERSRSIMKAWSIVNELLHSLDHTAGGDLSRNLARLYTYIQTRLLEANVKQLEPPLAEVEKLLSTLLEGWTSAVLPADFAQPSGDRLRAAATLNTKNETHTPEYVPVNCSY